MEIKDIADAIENVGNKANTAIQAVKGDVAELRDDMKSLQISLTDMAQKHEGQIPGGGGTKTGFGTANQLAKDILAAPGVEAWKSGSRLANRVQLDFDLHNLMVETKAAIVNSGDTMAPFDRVPGIVPLASRPRWLWQYLPMATTSSPAVEFLQETGSVRIAGIQSSEGSAKQESSFTFDLLKRDVETFAHWTQASRQVFADQPALGQFLNARLMEGISRKLENQIINGNGTSPNLSGLLDAGNYVAFSVSSTDEGGAGAIRRCIAEMQASGYFPNLLLLNPLDWSKIEAERTQDGAFVWASPQNAATPKLWGLPIHLTADLAAGTFIAMDTSAATLWTRQGATVLMSDSHGDTFTKNILTILAEGRFTFGVTRPEAVWSGELED